jgi:ATP-dependent Clp protease adaptor protein ClpS
MSRERTGQSILDVQSALDTHQVEKAPGARAEPNYHVILWNDNEHSPQYVIDMLIRLFSHSLAQAYDIAWRIDHLGKAVAGTCHRELAELRREQIQTYGADFSLPDARRISMRASLEPAAG